MRGDPVVFGLLAALLVRRAGCVPGVLMRETLEPPFRHSDENGTRVPSYLWETNGGVTTYDSFMRFSTGSAWTIAELDAPALSAEVVLRISGDSAATSVDPKYSTGMAIWFSADSKEVPTLTEAFRTADKRAEDSYVTEETHELIDEIDAFGAVFFARGARILARRADTGELISLGSCRANVRLDSSKRGFDPIRATRTARFELAAGAYTHDGRALEPGVGRGSGYARLIIRARSGNKKGLAKLCDLRVFDMSVLRNQTWLESTKLGVVSRAQFDSETSSSEMVADRHDMLSLTLRRSGGQDGRGMPGHLNKHHEDERKAAELKGQMSSDEETQAASVTRFESRVDAVLHSIDDLDAHYEHEKVYVRDDLESSLNSLFDARKRSVARIKELEDRTAESAERALTARLNKLEAELKKLIDKELHRSDSRIQHTARRETRKRAKKEGKKKWRLPFYALLVGPLVVVYKVRTKYNHYKKTHML